VPASVSANTISVPQGDAEAVERRLSEGDVAAVILEPTGMHFGATPLDSEFLGALREITQRHQTVLIFDEVVTGFRISPGGTQARYGVTPDMTTLAKIVAGGFPGGVVAGKSDILAMIEFRSDSGWNAERRVMHPGTFNANPVSSAAGSTMLSLIKDGRHHEHADALVARLVPGLNGVLEKRGAPGCVFGLTSTFHIVLGKDVPSPVNGVEWSADEPPPSMPGALGVALKRGMLNQGVDLMGGSGGFTSGVHTDADIDLTVEAFDATIASMQADELL
jgi:glutamate-1-semialdehyde 2,1-aminomutase